MVNRWKGAQIRNGQILNLWYHFGDKQIYGSEVGLGKSWTCSYIEKAKKRPVRNPSEEKAADKEAENIEKLDVACLRCSAVLRNEALAWDFIHIYLVTIVIILVSDNQLWSAMIGHILTVITIITVLTQFHSVTRVESNSNLAKAKSAFSGHDATTLKVNKLSASG